MSAIFCPFEVERGDGDTPEDPYRCHEVELEGYYSPGCRGSRRGDPGNWTPDDPEDVELCGATLDGKPFALTDAEEEKARDALLEAAREEYGDGAACAAEMRAEARAERDW